MQRQLMLFLSLRLLRPRPDADISQRLQGKEGESAKIPAGSPQAVMAAVLIGAPGDEAAAGAARAAGAAAATAATAAAAAQLQSDGMQQQQHHQVNAAAPTGEVLDMPPAARGTTEQLMAAPLRGPPYPSLPLRWKAAADINNRTAAADAMQQAVAPRRVISNNRHSHPNNNNSSSKVQGRATGSKTKKPTETKSRISHGSLACG